MSVFFFIKGLYAVESLVTTIFYFFSNSDQSGIVLNLSVIFPPFFMLITAIVLWVCAERIANLVVKGLDMDFSTDHNFDMLLNLSIITVGIVLAANAVPGLISDLYILSRYQDMLNESNTIKHVSSIISNSVRLIFGIWFILGFKGIGELVKKLGRAGIQ
jgi:hypothetical protein